VAVARSALRLTDEELDRFLTESRTLRLATVGDDGVPHVVPLWFAWHEGAVWLNSLVKSERHRHLRGGRPVGLVVDDGERYDELRGVRMTGRPEIVADDDPVRIEAYGKFGMKYFGTTELPNQRSYETVRIRPDEMASWDFRKIPSGADKKVGLDRSA
jgi:nitroimidazol reductase NimA-like FMN-containing flavoprotein (pyridoxamine 5'-phosphate oxidase superfamily)